MKHFLQIAGPAYVIFAIFAAVTAMAPVKEASAKRINPKAAVVALADFIFNPERLDIFNPSREGYVVEVWTASWCGPCTTYKSSEVPVLIRNGFEVKIRDIDKEKPPKDIKAVPTVNLYYKNTLLQQKTYWKAVDIIKYVDKINSVKR